MCKFICQLTCGIQWITIFQGLDFHLILYPWLTGFILWLFELIDQNSGHHMLMSSLSFYFFTINDRISVNILSCRLYFPIILSYLNFTWGICKSRETDALKRTGESDMAHPTWLLLFSMTAGQNEHWPGQNEQWHRLRSKTSQSPPNHEDSGLLL